MTEHSDLDHRLGTILVWGASAGIAVAFGAIGCLHVLGRESSFPGMHDLSNATGLMAVLGWLAWGGLGLLAATPVVMLLGLALNQARNREFTGLIASSGVLLVMAVALVLSLGRSG